MDYTIECDRLPILGDGDKEKYSCCSTACIWGAKIQNYRMDIGVKAQYWILASGCVST